MELLEDDLSYLAAFWDIGSDSAEEDEGKDEKKLLQERDEAKEKLAEFEHASQTLLAELSALEDEYEIEKSCRKQAEIYAAEVKRENTKLQRISMALLPMLDHFPEGLVSGGHGDEATSDSVEPYLQQIKDLQAKISQLLGEKKELVLQVGELQGQAQRLREQLEEQLSEKTTLQALMGQKQKAWKRVREVSRLVTEECGAMFRQLDLEQELRQQAETFAHQMLVKQKEANRQSMILMQGAEPGAQLLRALDEVAKLTRELEEAKLEHQAKVKDLEAHLLERPQLEDLEKLRAALAEAEKARASLERQLVQLEEKNTALEGTVKSLEETAKTSETPPPPVGVEPYPTAPVPPPPPPLPPPACPVPVDPLLAIRQKKGTRPEKQGTDDFKAKAMEEMMARIKTGVVLRSARKDGDPWSMAAAVNKRRSAVLDLQNLLGTTKRPVRKSRYKVSQKHRDNQLESLLKRRRQVTDGPDSVSALQQRSAIAPEQRPPLQAQGTPGGVNSKAELQRDPPAMRPDNADDHAATPALLSKENAAMAQIQQRAASLQMSRRIASTPGKLGPHAEVEHPDSHPCC